MRVRFHRLVQRDVDSALNHYAQEAGEQIAEAFFGAFEEIVGRALENPLRFHPWDSRLRRANMKRFPFHILYEKKSFGIYVWVCRHNKRHPHFGMGRLRR
ncbi:MAG: type II toxin-antitoxin system RelE/ParE family toxin [Verrucomicrobiaceae bacterium]